MVLDGTLSLDWPQSWKNDTPEKNKSTFYFQLEVLDWPQLRQKNPNFPFKHSY